MNDSRRDPYEVVDRICAELGVSIPMSALFTTMGFGFHLPPSELVERAPREFYGLRGDPHGAVTEEECLKALTDCFDRGWLRVLDESSRAKVIDDLASNGVQGPIFGNEPRIGCVDFTELGISLLSEIKNRLGRNESASAAPHFHFNECIHERESSFFKTQAAALLAMEQALEREGDVEVSGPFAIGSWRAQWWRRIPEGFRIEIDVRQAGCGFATELSEGCSFDWSSCRCRLHELPAILDRHNVTFAEWIFLASMEEHRSTHRSTRLLRRFAKRSFGKSVSNEELPIAAKACLKYGWLNRIDLPLVRGIRALVHSDTALIALPKTAFLLPRGCCYLPDPHHPGRLIPRPRDWGEHGDVTFSEGGVLLYRMIAAEWLGPNWEDGLYVSHVHHCVIRHYCESDRCFPSIIAEHEAKGDEVRSVLVEPIGPWCVDWWNVFPSGYRMDIEVSDRPIRCGTVSQ